MRYLYITLITCILSFIMSCQDGKVPHNREAKDSNSPSLSEEVPETPLSVDSSWGIAPSLLEEIKRTIISVDSSFGQNEQYFGKIFDVGSYLDRGMPSLYIATCPCYSPIKNAVKPVDMPDIFYLPDPDGYVIIMDRLIVFYMDSIHGRKFIHPENLLKNVEGTKFLNCDSTPRMEYEPSGKTYKIEGDRLILMEKIRL